MRMKTRLATVALFAVLATGCASVPMAPPAADAAAKTFQVAPDKANLYIYRNESMGAAVKMKVLIDGQPAGETGAKTYVLRAVDPGSHVVTSKAENESTITVDAAAGQNYFLWQEVKMGFGSARSALQLVDEAKGKAGVGACKLVQ